MLIEDFANKNDGEKMALLEELLDNVEQYLSQSWIDFLLELLQKDSSPCVRHEAAFCLGQMSKTQSLSNKEKISAIMCNVVENDNSMVVKHETMETLGDADIDTPQVRELLKKYKNNINYDLANTARISYWQLTGEW